MLWKLVLIFMGHGLQCGTTMGLLLLHFEVASWSFFLFYLLDWPFQKLKFVINYILNWSFRMLKKRCRKQQPQLCSSIYGSNGLKPSMLMRPKNNASVLAGKYNTIPFDNFFLTKFNFISLILVLICLCNSSSILEKL